MKLKPLDLHGVTSEEVIPMIDDFLLKQSQKKGIKKVQIMTGKGKGIVRSIVIEYLKKAHYQWEYEKKGQIINEGVICVFLD